MKKRSLALFCAFVMIFSVFAMGIQAKATEEKYKVGYSIQDMNPWKDPAEPTKGLMPLGLAGRGGNDIGRNVTGIFNDDGDKDWFGYYYATDDDRKNDVKTQGNNKVDLDDGLKTTCTAITDTKDNTVLFITLDTLGAWSNLTNDARMKIIESIEEDPDAWTHSQYGLPKINPNGITLSGSHTHSSIRLGDYGPYMENPTEDGNKYYKYVVDQIVLAAQQAWTDSAYATMYKNTVDVSDVLNAYREDVNATFPGLKNATNMQLNFVRHWNHHYVASYVSKKADGTNKYDPIIIDGKQVAFDVVAGSNFGTSAGAVNYITEYLKKYHYNDVDWNKTIGVNVYYAKTPTNAADKGRDRGPITSKDGTEVPADDRLHLIEFRFEDNRKPVVMVNWRAHTTENGSYYGAASSDYAGALRSVMGENYRVAFFLGAAGNLTINFANSVGPYLTPWRYGDYGSNSTNYKVYTSGNNRPGIVRLYAKLLAYAADTVLGGDSGMMLAGEIRVTYSQFAAERQTNTDAQVKAVEELINTYRKRNTNGSFSTADDKDVSWKKSWTYYPYVAKDGVTVINSYFEAGTIAGRCNETVSTDPVTGKQMVSLTPKYGEETYAYVTLSAIALGDNTAFVTAPFELSDRYYDNPQSGDLTQNAWQELESLGYDTPFVLSCTNGYVSYLPSSIEYLYNTEKFAEYFDQAEDGPTIFGAGSYESHISPYVSGTGEKMIDEFVEMLMSLKNNNYAKPEYCEICKQEVFWQPINNEKMVSVTGGHYYLAEDIENGLRHTVDVGNTLHFDLNGHKYEVDDKAFHLNNSSTLNITDSVGGGEVVSHAVDATYGAAVVVAGSATFNWYANGTLYCDAVPTASFPEARTIFAYGKVNVYGGAIRSGSVISGKNAPCVYLADANKAVITLSNNATVEEIYLANYSKNKVIVDESQGAYTGSAGLAVNAASVGTVFGTGSAAAAARLAVVTPVGYGVASVNNQLKLVRETAVPIAEIDGVEFNTIAKALAAYKEKDVITLLRNVTTAFKLKADTYIDLNGFDIIGKVTVPEGKTLYCMDSTTDDYDIEDGVYGKICNYTGVIKAATTATDSVRKDYLKVAEVTGISFHCVNLKLTHITVIPGTASIKYKSAFEGDRLVADNVKQYGIAFNLSEHPNADNMREGTYSVFKNFLPGFNANGTAASTAVVNIMKSGQSDELNDKNAKMPIYGSAYIVTNEGEYLFGQVEDKTFLQAIESIDASWDALSADQKNLCVALYKQFEGNMKSWGLTRMQEAAAK